MTAEHHTEEMTAVVLPAFGGPDAFERREVPRPEPGPNEVCVRVHATSVNPIDAKMREHGAGMGVDLPAVLGYDVSGVVVEAGPGVERLAPGDEVFYTPALFAGDGAYAEYHVARADLVARKPAGLSHVEAAALPVAACTAWDALVDRAPVGVGDAVLVHGAGGVGSAAVQLAHAAGAEVVASCSPETVDLAESLGATRAVDYRSGSFRDAVEAVTGGDGVDVTLATAAGVLEGSIPATRHHGHLVDLVGDPGDLGEAKSRNLTVTFMALARDHEKLDGVRRLVEAGRLAPVVDDVLDLADVAAAHRRLEAGGLAGKLVLRVAD